ncbi:MAG: patatin-like phospholipase family protein [Ferruginibacter sp.]|nr:patatin-like phospholipase family protein [Ferruginibacter sp.]
MIQHPLKIGYVLSGGGARGFAHLGVLQFLEELNIRPYAISGTSSGAIVGALYAAGKTPREILCLMKKKKLFGLSSLRWKRHSFFSMHILRKLLTNVIERDNFDSLVIKLFVTATDINEGKAVTFSKGDLFEPVIASASIPVLFEPVIIGNRTLIDGGIMNNFPVEPLEGICDLIIGSHVNKIESDKGNKLHLSKLKLLERSFYLSIANAVYEKKDKCQVFIESPLGNFDMYDVKKAAMIFNIGYKAAAESKEKILALFTDRKNSILA